MALLPQETIRRKRDGDRLEAEAIEAFVTGVADGSISEGQAAAFAMAVFFRGLESEEGVALTRAMTRSGRVLDWPDVGRPVLDKHSTGGVGDKVSLMLAPIVAACGGAVPMISGRGLGHTGGTLDKLDAIPGYDTAPDIGTFQRVVAESGCAIIGQTVDLAPADRRLYAIRDVTATVESIPLITASILSKKLAAGLGGLVMDVKVGNGAFMQEIGQARALARSIVDVANGAGLQTRALITDMNRVLGRAVGNALEVVEALDYLTGRSRDPRLHEVTSALSAELLEMSGLAEDRDSAFAAIQRVLDDGSAAEHFASMVAALGGPKDLLEASARHLAKAKVVRPLFADEQGVVAAVDTRAIGLALIRLGGGRTRADQAIDHSVGFTDVAAPGESLGPDRPLAVVHARDEEGARQAESDLRAAFVVRDHAGDDQPVIHERLL